MRLPKPYESYLFEMKDLYGEMYSIYNEAPIWLKHESQVFGWILRLSRHFVDRITNERKVLLRYLADLLSHAHSRFDGYDDINPQLEIAYRICMDSLTCLHDDLLTEDGMWKRKGSLSWKGQDAYMRCASQLYDASRIHPDQEWREKLEKEKNPNSCTRREARRQAFDFLHGQFGIYEEITERGIDGIAKESIYRCRLARRKEESRLRNLVLTIDMKSRMIISCEEAVSKETIERLFGWYQ